MNKKGFTLTELVAVVVILGLVGLLAFPKLLSLIKDNDEKIDDYTTNLILNAARQYTSKYENNFSKVEDNIYCIIVEDLVKEKMLTGEILNVPLSTKVQVDVNSNLKFEYQINNDCVENN